MLLWLSRHRPPVAVTPAVASAIPRRPRPAPPLRFLLLRSIRSLWIRKYLTSAWSMMENATLLSSQSQASTRTCIISGFSSELLEMNSKEASLQVVVVPGNPGIVPFYKDFIEALYEQLEGNASITAIAHISHSAQDLEHGRMFSLQEQIDHKVHFIEQEFQSCERPVILVGHSIGSYICLEVFKRLPEKVKCVIGMYPFLTMNKDSFEQTIIGIIVRSSILSIVVSSLVSMLGSLPTRVQMVLVKKLLGQSWSTTAIDATCSHLLKYHTMRNVLFMAKTEFEKLSEEPDWQFIKRKKNQISLLFGDDDHWGPLSHYEEVSRQVPGLALSIEREGHTHAFSCTEAGSLFVARHVASVIKNQIAV